MHTPKQRVAASTLRWYSFSIRLAIAQADARPSRTYATMKRVDALSAWSSLSDLDKKESDERDSPQAVAPQAHRGVVGAHEL